MDKTIVSVLSGLGGMFGWGVSDFFANLSSDKIGHFRTFFWSQVAGISLFFIAFFLVRPDFVFSPFLVFLLIVGAFGYALGYLFFYKAFEVGNVSVVSAVINLNTILAMSVAIILFGQKLSPLQILGVSAVIIGVTLVGVNFKDLKNGGVALTKGVKETILASVLFGVFYWPVNEYITERAHWLSTSIIIKLLSLFIVLVIAKLQKKQLGVENRGKNLIWLIALVGILEAVGVLSTSFGVSIGDSVLVAPIASALSIVTISLAIIFLKEKITKIQGVGIVMAVIGIVLTAF